MAGLPPLSGFLGKLLVLDAAFGTDLVVWIWAIILGSSLISIVGFARAGSILFWKAHSVEPPEDEHRACRAPPTLSYVAVGGLIALLVAHTVFAGQVHGYTTHHRGPAVRARALYLDRGGHAGQAEQARRRIIDMARAFHWLLPHPLLTLLLAVVWTLLQNEVSAGMVVFGIILGIIIPWGTSVWWPDTPKGFRLGKMITYSVDGDVGYLVANMQVAWIVLTVPECQAETGLDRRSRWSCASPRPSRCWPAPSR